MSQPAKGYWNRRRRRKGPRWTRIKNICKKKLEAAPLLPLIFADVSHNEPEALIVASEPSASATTASVPPVSPAITSSASASESDHSPASDTAQSPERATSPVLPYTTAAIPSDPSQAEQDHGIAAYVTLSINGECCVEQDAVVKQISQLPTSSPETEQSNVMIAHEIEMATSNVPVYLLNGESRDVTTPVPGTLTNEEFAVEP